VPKRILLLDDNPDFTGLLTDIFRQSGHETVPFTDPAAALDVLRTETFDLLVTDHRMPGMTGEVLVRELRKTHPSTPVIVVSGFLDNDTIRDLIRDGVGGIFLKPLNVVNLLRRTAALLNEADAGRKDTDTDQAETHRLPFPFESFPALAAASADFARKLYAKRQFRGAMTLIAPAGSPLREILEDLRKFDAKDPSLFRKVNAEAAGVDKLLGEIVAAREIGRPLTLVLPGLDRLSAAQRAPVIALCKRQPPFDAHPAPRLMFVFERPVDELFDKGLIDEALYLFASVNEIAVPPLISCREDIPVLAERMLARHAETAGIVPAPKLHKQARPWLLERPWPGNHEELYSRITRAALGAQGGFVTRESFLADADDSLWPGSGAESFSSYLARLRDDYIRAVLVLCDGDTELAAATIGIPLAKLMAYPEFVDAANPNRHD